MCEKDYMFKADRSPDRRVSYKLKKKLWPRPLILAETFQISLQGQIGLCGMMPVALGTLCLIIRGHFYPLLLPFSSLIASKHALLIYPGVQRENHPDKQTNTQTPKNVGHVHKDLDFVQGFATLCFYRHLLFEVALHILSLKTAVFKEWKLQGTAFLPLGGLPGVGVK